MRTPSYPKFGFTTPTVPSATQFPATGLTAGLVAGAAATPTPVSVAAPVGAGHSLWIGWLEIDLHPYSVHGPAQPGMPQVAAAEVFSTQRVSPSLQPAVATLDVSVRVDIVTLWIASRTVAVLDRDHLRDWVHAPEVPLRVDDVEFVLIDRQLCLRIDGGGPLPLPTDAVSVLVSAL